MLEAVYVGRWKLESDSNRLSNGSVEAELEPMPASLLRVLITNPGSAMSHAALINALSPEHVVDDASVDRAIRSLRLTLESDGQEPVCIDTVSQGGYRLIAPVSTVAPDSLTPETPPILAPDITDHRQGFTLLVAAALGIAAVGMMAYQHFFGDPVESPDAANVEVKPADSADTNK